MDKLFGSINEIDFHKKFQTFIFILGKVLGHSVWLDMVMYYRFIGMTITNFWKLFLVGLRDNTMTELLV